MAKSISLVRSRKLLSAFYFIYLETFLRRPCPMNLGMLYLIDSNTLLT